MRVVVGCLTIIATVTPIDFILTTSQTQQCARHQPNYNHYLKNNESVHQSIDTLLFLATIADEEVRGEGK